MYPLIYNQVVSYDNRLPDVPESDEAQPLIEPGRPEHSVPQDPPRAEAPAEVDRGWQPTQAAHTPVSIQSVASRDPLGDGSVTVDGVKYLPAGFMPRFWAFLIDAVILAMFHSLLLAFLNYQPPDEKAMLELLSQMMAAMLAMQVPGGELLSKLEELQRVARIAGWLNVAVCFSYYTIFHTVAGATLGKLCLGLTVMTTRGHRISYTTACLRYGVRLLLSRFFFGGAFTVFFDPRRRTAYDMVAGTNVYRPISRAQMELDD